MSQKQDSCGCLRTAALLFICAAAIYALVSVDAGNSENAEPDSTAVFAQAEHTRLSSSSIEPASEPAYASTDRLDEIWYLTLVNKQHPLPVDFTPQVRPVDNGNYSFDSRASDMLERMLEDCRSEGLYPIICSAYRSMDKQEQLYERQKHKQKADGLDEAEALAAAATVVAYPGTSEHNLGLAVDIVSRDYQLLDRGQENTAEYSWLLKHCHEYGFILRYPDDKQQLTGIIYEPWHFRYVGTEAAAEIMSRGICLEEYLGV